MEKYVEERDKKYLQKLRDDVLPYLPNFCYERCETCSEISNDINDQKCLSCNDNYILSNGNCIIINCSENWRDYQKKINTENNECVDNFIQRLQENRNVYFRLYNALYVVSSEKSKIYIHQDGVLVNYTYPSLENLFNEYIVYGLPLIDAIDDIKMV